MYYCEIEIRNDEYQMQGKLLLALDTAKQIDFLSFMRQIHDAGMKLDSYLHLKSSADFNVTARSGEYTYWEYRKEATWPTSKLS